MTKLVVTESRYWYERYLKERGETRETAKHIWKRTQLGKLSINIAELSIVFTNGSIKLEPEIMDIVVVGQAEWDYLTPVNGVL